jgi:hypothetical protein
VTTEPAPTIALDPIRIPETIVELAPTVDLSATSVFSQSSGYV